jgi:succinate dehydrogenase/fumarate reductase flavoprotein subunit
VCYIKSEARLKQALEGLAGLKEQTDKLHAANLHELVKANEARSMVAVAEAFLHSSLCRQESRGFHFREDFPLTNNRDWLKWIMLREENGQFKLWTKEIPSPLVSPQEDLTRARGTRIEE